MAAADAAARAPREEDDRKARIEDDLEQQRPGGRVDRRNAQAVYAVEQHEVGEQVRREEMRPTVVRDGDSDRGDDQHRVEAHEAIAQESPVVEPRPVDEAQHEVAAQQEEQVYAVV
jgi:hypothetical protein